MRNRLFPILGRIGFALLSAAVLIVFSEKMFWYVTGYSFLDLLIGYFFPAFILLWVIDAFRVRRLAPLFLAGAVFGFLAEGMLVGTIYEGGPLNWFSVSYTPLAWHAPLSVVFGWYALRRWLVAGRPRAMALGCAAVGLFWGLWAMAWWLPENATDPVLLAQGARLGQWPVGEFALHAFTFSGVLAVALWLLGRGGWSSFRPSKVEVAVVVAGLLVFFVAGVLLAVPWAPLKLLPLLGVTLLALYVNKRKEPPGSLLADVAGPVQLARLPLLLVMPAVAVAVYALGVVLAVPVEVIYGITAVGGVMGTAVLGALVFLAALVWTIRGSRNR
ncbi:MAG TPA: hypothetical protein PLC06_14445 [Promineifilum sp.]|nr:hypothetical protein [Promineifilum sp.]